MLTTILTVAIFAALFAAALNEARKAGRDE